MLEMLGMNVLVKVDEEVEKVSRGGIITPGTVRKNSVQKAKVLAVGPGEFQNGVFVELSGIKAGDTVLIDKDFTKSVDVEGDEQHILGYRDVLGKVS